MIKTILIVSVKRVFSLKNSSMWHIIINISIMYQSCKRQISGRAKRATISLLIWSTKNESGASCMHIIRVLSEKNSSPEISLSVAFVYPLPFFSLSLCGRNHDDVLSEKRLEIGTTRRDATRDFLLLSSIIYARSYPNDNAKCIHRLTCGRNARSGVLFRI